MIKVQFEEKYVTCYFDDTIPVLGHEWKGFVNGENMKNTMLRMVDIFTELRKEYPNLTWLGNTTDMSAIAVVYQQWLKEDWPIMMKEKGINKHALVIPKNMFAKTAMDKFVEDLTKNHQNIKIRPFHDLESANEWLKAESC
ncbi:MAG: hypothetical protein V4714_20490 [Bacteroidota bacterium]